MNIAGQIMEEISFLDCENVSWGPKGSPKDFKLIIRTNALFMIFEGIDEDKVQSYEIRLASILGNLVEN